MITYKGILSPRTPIIEPVHQVVDEEDDFILSTYEIPRDLFRDMKWCCELFTGAVLFGGGYMISGRCGRAVKNELFSKFTILVRNGDFIPNEAPMDDYVMTMFNSGKMILESKKTEVVITSSYLFNPAETSDIDVVSVNDDEVIEIKLSKKAFQSGIRNFYFKHAEVTTGRRSWTTLGSAKGVYLYSSISRTDFFKAFGKSGEYRLKVYGSYRKFLVSNDGPRVSFQRVY